MTLSLSENSLKILERRYLAKNEKRELIETPEEMFSRVANNIASAEALYGGDVERMGLDFYEIMTSFKFLPNSPTLMNAGRELQQLSACFVIPIDDSIDSIFDAVKYTALIHKSGGGTGFAFSRLRPKNDVVRTTGGIASGPISFMKVLNTSTEVIKQGGCLVPNTLVFSNKGLLRLNELVDEKVRGWQEHDLKVATDNGEKISPRGYNNGVVSVLRVTTEQEINLTGTPNHKVKVMTDEGTVWRQLSELRPGDAILVKLGQHRGQIQKLKHLEIQHHNQKEIDLPSVLDESLAFLLGLLAGDGFVASGLKDYRIGFSISHNSYLIEELPEFLEKLFPGIHVQLMQKDDDASVNFIVSSRSLKEFLVLNNLSKEESHKVSVPLLIRKSPPSVVGAYLRGLFEADGTITHGYPVLTSTSHRLIQEASALLIGLGCPVSIREIPANEDRFGSDNLWSLKLRSHVALDVWKDKIGCDSRSRFVSCYDFSPDLEREQNYVLPSVKWWVEPVLKAITLPQRDKKGRGMGKKFRSTAPKLRNKLLRYIRGERQFTFSAYCNLSKEYPEFTANARDVNNLWFITVTDIQKVGKSQTMDLEVNENHTYLAHGMVTHNTRRGANMGILRVDHPDIIEFITSKSDLTELTNFNISVAATDEFMKAVKTDRKYNLINPRTNKIVETLDAKDVFDLIIEMAWKNGEPGLFFIDRANQFNPTPALGDYESTNPCLPGDTLIATADGRGTIPIEKLANEDKDVPVFTENNDGKIVVRHMRRPRLTGKNVPVYKIALDSGDVIKATKNHVFYLRDGTSRRTDELKPGDSLHVLTKVLQWQKGKYTKNRSKKYWRMYNRGISDKSEHNIIARFFHNNNKEISEDCVVHHIDFNSTNNSPTNLEILRISDHDQLHSHSIKGENNPLYKLKQNKEVWEKYKAENPFYNTKGENNPNYGKHHSEETKRKIGEKSRELFANPEVRKAFSERMTKLWNDENYQKNAEKGFHKRALRKLEECREKTDLQCYLKGNSVMVKKTCENCGSEFSISFSERELGFCGKECFMDFLNSDDSIFEKRVEGVRNAYKERARRNKEQQIEKYIELLDKLDRVPFKKEWEDFCKESIVTFRLETKYGFKTYKELKEAADMYNHKIVSIEYLGKEDVYNGTVDDFHTFFIGGFESKSKNRKKVRFIKTKNCGEQLLLPMESCNLGSINLSKMVKQENGHCTVDYEELKRVVRLSVRFLDNVIDMNNYPLPEIEKMTKENRKIGLGVMGWADLLIQLRIPYDSLDALELAEKIMRFISEEGRKASEDLAKERGQFPSFDDSIYKDSTPLRNATVTTIAPTGTISMIADCSSGIEPLFAVSYFKKVMDGEKLVTVNSYFEGIANEEGIYSQDLMQKIAEQGTIQKIDEIPEHIRRLFVTAHDITPEWHVRMQAAFQKYTDNAVSKTVNMPQEATKSDVATVFMTAYELGCKGVTVFRYGSREAVVNIGKAEEAPKEDVLTPRTRPSVTVGETERIRTGCGNLYVTINADSEGLFEVFSTLGHSGGCPSAQSEAISRLISLSLRSGVKIESIVKQLREIRCPSASWDEGTLILSCPDAIGKALSRYIERHEIEGSYEKTAMKSYYGVCPDCGGQLVHEEGCLICKSCGASKCE